LDLVIAIVLERANSRLMHCRTEQSLSKISNTGK
jgi:hypothetical protein